MSHRVVSIKAELPLTPNQHEWLMGLIKDGVAANMEVYFEEGKFWIEFGDPRGGILPQNPVKIAPAKD